MNINLQKCIGIFLFCFLVVNVTLNAQTPSNRIAFSASLFGEDEVPPTTSVATGLVTGLLSEDLKTMDVHGVVNGLSGPITSAHFHAGAIGSNGGAVVNLTPFIVGNRIQGKVPISPAVLNAMLNFGIYVNVHTAMFPGGEIRGQMFTHQDWTIVALMSGANENPPTSSSAIGIGWLQYKAGADVYNYRFVANGLSGPITNAHIHEGAQGANGPVVVALNKTSDNQLAGTLDATTLPDDFFLNLLLGQYYVNIHTAANPAGEIRDQLSFVGSLGVVSELNSDQENPPTNSTATGLGIGFFGNSLDTMTYVVVTQGLTGPPTAAHIHRAFAGANGGVAAGIMPTQVPGVYFGNVVLDDAAKMTLLNHGFYFNVHTAANPGGEIRGQIFSNLRKAYTFDLCGEQEVPAKMNNTIGAGIVSIDNGNEGLVYELLVDGLSGTATAAHIHANVVGANGPVLIPLVAPNPYTYEEIKISGAQAVQIDNGGTYVNIHTTSNPGGEMRGQIQRKNLCSFLSDIEEPTEFSSRLVTNIVVDELRLDVSSNRDIQTYVIITNSLGQEVIRESLLVAAHQINHTIDIHSTATGAYQLNIISENGKVLFGKKFIKI